MRAGYVDMKIFYPNKMKVFLYRLVLLPLGMLLFYLDFEHLIFLSIIYVFLEIYFYVLNIRIDGHTLYIKYVFGELALPIESISSVQRTLLTSREEILLYVSLRNGRTVKKYLIPKSLFSKNDIDEIISLLRFRLED